MIRDAGLHDTGHDNPEWRTTGRDTDPDEAGINATDPGSGDAPDLRKLAQDWITLWQSELSAMAADPEIRESWQTIMALWAGSMSVMLRGLPRDPSDYRHEPRRHPGAADASRAAAAAAAPDARDAEIERLARHVAALERRLAELERHGDPPVHSSSRSRRKPQQ